MVFLLLNKWQMFISGRIMYCAGYFVTQDMAEGLKWLRKAAEQGLAEAQTVIMLATAGN